LKKKVETIDIQLKDLGIKLNKGGELTKILKSMLDMNNRLGEIKEIVSDDYLIKLIKKKNGKD